MTKNKSQSQQNITAEGASTVGAMSEETAEKVVSIGKAKGQRSNRFEREDVAITQAAATKTQLLADARKSFHEAAQLAAKGADSEGKAAEVANRGGILLFRGRISGVLSPDEVSAVLGDEFGWKGRGVKSGQRVTSAEPDATRSATPFGVGEAVRKRVVRAVGAHNFVNGNTEAAGAFFKPLAVETVQPLLNAVTQEGGNLWTLYDKLAAAKNEAAGTRPKLAFDAKRIASITATLGENIGHSVEMMQSNPGLFDAYLGLYRMLGVIGREMPEDEASVA